MLKLTTLILGTFFSFTAMASTHGGGVLMKNAMMRAGNGAGTMDALLGSGGGGAVLNSTNDGGPIGTKEIIFNMGQKDGLVKFAYGQLVDRKWQVQKIEMPETELEIDPAVINALRNSKLKNSWSEIE